MPSGATLDVVTLSTQDGRTVDVPRAVALELGVLAALLDEEGVDVGTVPVALDLPTLQRAS